MPHRPTAAEKEARVSQVMTALLGGSRRIEIVQFAAKTWGVESRQADAYIANATALIKASASKTRDEEIVEHIGRMDLIFRAAHGAGDYHAAIKAAQDKAKLRGLYPVVRTELQINGMSDEQLADAVNQLVGGLGIRIEPPDGEGLQAAASGNGNGDHAG